MFNIGMTISLILIYFQLEPLEDLLDLLQDGAITVNVANSVLKVTNSGSCVGTNCVDF